MVFRPVLFRAAWRASTASARLVFASRPAAQILAAPASPARALLAGALAMGTATAAAAACDMSEKELDEQLVHARKMMKRLATSSNEATEHFIKRSRQVYLKHQNKDGQLGLPELTAALKDLEDWRMPIAAEMAPMLLRLLDDDGDGNVSIKEFVVGEAIIHAVAHSKESVHLKTITWRALDADGSGFIDRGELATMVRIMVRLGAVREQEAKVLNLQIATRTQSMRGHHDKAKVTRIKKEQVEHLIDHYMRMYDTAQDGRISKAEFEKHTALMENFYHLLKHHSIEPLFLIES